ncbi:MAG: hypothetical protein JJ858_10165 [Rhizobiaceae bacterium]|nr:hypothetical protein [Rhizobiaceae bacterium]
MGEKQTTNLEKSEALLGYILSKLYEQGLRRLTITSDEFLQFDQQIDGDLILDVACWMQNEGLIYARLDYRTNRRARLRPIKYLRLDDLQLSSKGIHVLRHVKSQRTLIDFEPNGDASRASVDGYTKLGAAVGGLLGGVIKSVS